MGPQYAKDFKVGDRVKVSRRHGPWELRGKIGQVVSTRLVNGTVSKYIYEVSFPCEKEPRTLIRPELVVA